VDFVVSIYEFRIRAGRIAQLKKCESLQAMQLMQLTAQALLQYISSSNLLSKNLNIKMFSTILLSVVFCGCETWSLTLTEERRLRIFENTVLRILVIGGTR
jgi:hypothetical protein